MPEYAPVLARIAAADLGGDASAGLALAFRLAEAHGGTIVADNRKDWSGAVFRVDLPLGR